MEDYDNLQLPWGKLLNVEGSARVLCFRDLANTELSNIMRAHLFQDLFEWRGTNRTPLSISVDEFMDVLKAVFGSTGESQLAKSAQDVMTDFRGYGIEFRFATQQANLINPIALAFMTNAFISRIPETGREASRSPRQQVLKVLESMLEDQEKPYITTLEKIMENIPIHRHHLFFMVSEGKLDLVRSPLPSHAIEATNMNVTDILRATEREPGEILCSANEVPQEILTPKKRSQSSKLPDKYRG